MPLSNRTGNQVVPSKAYSNQPMILPHEDDDGDAEMEIVEESEHNLDRKETTSQKKDVGVQAVAQGNESEEEKHVFLCKKCKGSSNEKNGNDSTNLQFVSSGGSQSTDQNKTFVSKALEKVLSGAIRREMALEKLCTRQKTEIIQLNCLLQQYKHEREFNLYISQIREDQIARVESLMDDILSAQEFKDKEIVSLKNENKILKENYENNPEVLRTEIEYKRVQDDIERYQNFFDLGEREILLEEIQDLKTQLQLYMDSSSSKRNKSCK